MARSLTPAVPAKMYRHFAAVTLALTAAVAMFADGGNREADAAAPQHIGSKRTVALRHQPAPQLRGSPPPIADYTNPSDGSFGLPTSGAEAGLARAMTPFDALLAAGYGRSHIEGMSESDRQRLLADLRRSGAGEPDRRAQVAALSAASAARSGRLTASD